MAFTVKSERVQQLAREAARLTGRSQVSALEEALVRLIEAYGSDPDSVRAADTVARAREIVHAYQSAPGDDERTIRSVEDLYDESGMPR